MDCKHTNTTPTGDIRDWANCQSTGIKGKAHVELCADCGSYVQKRDGEVAVVAPPLPVEAIMSQVRTGMITKAQGMAFGHLSDTERQVIREMKLCDHHHYDTIVTYRCKGCGMPVNPQQEEN